VRDYLAFLCALQHDSMQVRAGRCCACLYIYMLVYICNINRVGQNHIFIGIYGVHTVFLAWKSIHTVMYGADIRFWPTRNI